MTKRLVLCALCALVTPAFAEDVWVQVRESRLRAKPLFYAPSVSSVRYGDRLTKVSEDSGWVGVKLGTQQGFVPLSAVTPKQIAFSSADVSKVTGDSSDLVLAGKGFSKEVEQSFKRQDATARYDLVDKVERVAKVSPQTIAKFAHDGGLVK